MSQKTYTRNYFDELARYAYDYDGEEPRFSDALADLVPGKKVKLTCNGTEAIITITPDTTEQEDAAIQALVDTKNSGGDQ